jgi:hypothetical protein
VWSVTGRFACGILAWIPADLGEAESEHLSEHAALAAMVTDHTLFRRRDSDFRARVRERWADSEAETQRIVQRAYYGGRVIALDGADVIEPDRLWGLFGDWDGTLTAILERPFGRLFPRFGSIAPERQIVGRAQTNRIIDQFIRPGEVVLPPASALEAHIHALARPLGLAAGADRHLRLALENRELLEVALSLTPPRTGKPEIDPDETVRYGELVGRIAKSEWGLVGEQADLLVAALMRTGYLVGLDAFLQPVRLEAVVAPLRHSLPYVMRGEALEDELGERAAALWRGISGKPMDAWDLPAQERAWGSIIDWSARLTESAHESRTAIQRAADALGHQAEDWAWSEHALATAEALAETVDQSLTSKEGLTSFVGAAERLPGGLAETAALVGRWRVCADFISHHLDELAQLRLLLTDARLRLPDGSMLAREHSALLARFGLSEQFVSDPHEVKTSAQRWLESYRRHYLGWHSRVHAAAAFEPLLGLRRSPALRSARALAQAGISGADLAAIESEITGALSRRCLAGDPLPPRCVVCRICGLEMGEDLSLPDAEELRERVEQALAAQLKGLAEQSDLLRRRLAACPSPGVKSAVGALLAGSPDRPPDEIVDLLTGEAVAWTRRQLDRPAAPQRKLSDLEDQLRGKELTRREVIQLVESWLGAGDDDPIEIV